METSSLLLLLNADILQSKRAWNKANLAALLNQPSYPPVIIIFLEHRKVTGFSSKCSTFETLFSTILSSILINETGLTLTPECWIICVNLSEVKGIWEINVFSAARQWKAGISTAVLAYLLTAPTHPVCCDFSSDVTH